VIDAVIADAAMEAPGIRSLHLASASGATLPPCEPGAHVDVEVSPGLVRQYSVYEARGDRYAIAVQLELGSRGGSAAMHEMPLGQRLRVGAPRNLFPIDPAASHHVLVAGGIGITPLLAMAEELHAKGRPFRLHYCVRGVEQAAFLERIRRTGVDAFFTLHASHGTAPNRLDVRQALAGAPPGAHVYVCGPQRLVDGVQEAARACSWSDQRIHAERFTPVPAGALAATPFTVRIFRTGQLIRVGAHERMLDALRRADIDVPTACEQGFCGSCLTPVVDGIPWHADACQSEAQHAAGTHVAPCCSRSRTDVLTLDL
jgi:vanillate O-demethylase ferredoxin subunit